MKRTAILAIAVALAAFIAVGCGCFKGRYYHAQKSKCGSCSDKAEVKSGCAGKCGSCSKKADSASGYHAEKVKSGSYSIKAKSEVGYHAEGGMTKAIHLSVKQFDGMADDSGDYSLIGIECLYKEGYGLWKVTYMLTKLLPEKEGAFAGRGGQVIFTINVETEEVSVTRGR